MYFIEDRSKAYVATYLKGLKAKNIILANWPNNGTQFTPLYYYIKGQGIQKSPAHLKLYKLMGINVADLDKQEFKGLDAAWFTFKRYETAFIITNSQISDYIKDNSPYMLLEEIGLDEGGAPILGYLPIVVPEGADYDKYGWFRVPLAYSVSNRVLASSYVDNATIIAEMRANYSSIKFDSEDDPATTFAAIMDINGEVFEQQWTVWNKTIVQDPTTGKYSIQASVGLQYRRVSNTLPTPYLDTINAKFDAINAVKPMINRWFQGDMTEYVHTAVQSQILNMYYSVVTVTETALSTTNGIKVQGVRDLLVKEFSGVFDKILTTGYSKTKTKWYKKLLVVVLTIIIIVIAVVVFVISGGGASGLSYALLALAVGQFAMGQLGAYWARHGDYSASDYTGKSIKVLQLISLVGSIILLIMSGIDWATAADQFLSNVSEQGLMEATSQAVSASLASGANMTTAQVLAQTVSYVNMGFSAYTKYVAPADEGISELQAELASSEATLADLGTIVSPDFINIANSYDDSAGDNWADTNAPLHNMVYDMTFAKIDNAITPWANREVVWTLG